MRDEERDLLIDEMLKDYAAIDVELQAQYGIPAETSRIAAAILMAHLRPEVTERVGDLSITRKGSAVHEKPNAPPYEE
jgi:hypothetical protein